MDAYSQLLSTVHIAPMRAMWGLGHCGVFTDRQERHVNTAWTALVVLLRVTADGHKQERLINDVTNTQLQ